MKDEIKWALLAGSSAAAAAFLTRRIGRSVWKGIGGTPPPEDPELDETSVRDAVLWTVLGTSAVGVSRLLARRGAAALWRRRKGSAPPAGRSIFD